MIRFGTRAFLSGFSVLATLLFATIMSVSAHEQKIVWHYGETCVMSMENIGGNDASSYWAHVNDAQVVDIHELYDKRNRVVGLVYLTYQGQKSYQANWLMPEADRRRLHLEYYDWDWSGGYRYNAALVGYRERECLPSHVTSGRIIREVIFELERKAYSEHRDFIPDPRNARNWGNAPVLIPGKDW